MGILFGILCLICFGVLSAKALSARLHFKKMDKILMKFHKPISAFLIITCFVHILFVVSVLKNRDVLVMISGIINIGFMVLLIYLCHAIKDRKRRILWHRILTLLMAVGITVHFTADIIDFNRYQKNVASIEFDDIDLGNVEDGIYRGECDVGYIYAKVKVEIKDGMIVSIDLLEHRNERGKRAESIIDDVILKQKINVDAVSGATNSSNVIKKAIENALQTEVIAEVQKGKVNDF